MIPENLNPVRSERKIQLFTSLQAPELQLDVLFFFGALCILLLFVTVHASACCFLVFLIIFSSLSSVFQGKLTTNHPKVPVACIDQRK